jgi:uracil-DNA glycosylase family 4
MIPKDFEQKKQHAPAGPLTPNTAHAWALWHHHTLDITQGVFLPDHQAALHQKTLNTTQPVAPSLAHTIKEPTGFNDQGVGAEKNPSESLIKSTTPISQPPSAMHTSFPENSSEVPPSAPLNPAEKEAALKHLSQRMKAFQDLPITQSAENMVFSDGNPQSSIMLIGEAPGAEEDRQGRPFVGASGKLLDAMMASIGLDRTQVYIANVVAWRPPFNRQPSAQEIAACLPFLHQHIHIIQPRVIICVGGVAAKALLCLDQTLTQSQGQELAYKCPIQSRSITAFTLYHPAYLMRSPGQKKVAWQQLLYIQDFLKGIASDSVKNKTNASSD